MRSLTPDGQGSEVSGLPASSGSDDGRQGGGAASADDVQHRMRNMLGVMRSVLSRTAESGTSLEEVAAHLQGRFDTLAPYLTSCVSGVRETYDLETLVWDEVLRYPVGNDSNVEADGPPERLPPTLAQPIALALHELATNALKFGALATPDRSRIKIDWRREGEFLVLRWRELGVSIVQPAPLPYGFGREFIEQGLPYQIGAQTSFEIQPGGVLSIIRVPMPPPATADPAP